MIGRQVIPISRTLSKEELLAFMEANWDKETYNPFIFGKPTELSVDEYIILPATPRYVTIVYPVKKGGLFNKTDKIVLTTVDSPSGATEGLLRQIPARSVVFGATKMASLKSAEKERKGPAEEALQIYTAYMKELLEREGLLL